MPTTTLTYPRVNTDINRTEQHDLSAEVTLKDGSTVQIRPITPSDKEALHRFHAGLSPTSRYYRFFNHHPTLSDKEAEHFTSPDQNTRVALVATTSDRLVAVARFERPPHQPTADLAFVVTDEFQRLGLGTVLLNKLIAAARLRGIQSLHATTLADNRSMLVLLHSCSHPVTSRFEGGVIELQVDITRQLMAH